MANCLESNVVTYACACGHLNPITKLFFCRHCLKLRCGFCVCHEVCVQRKTKKVRKSIRIVSNTIRFLSKFRSIHISAAFAWRIFHRRRRNWKNIDAINASNAQVVSTHCPHEPPLFKSVSQNPVAPKSMWNRIRTLLLQLLMPRNRRKLQHAKCTTYRAWRVDGHREMSACPIKPMVRQCCAILIISCSLFNVNCISCSDRELAGKWIRSCDPFFVSHGILSECCSTWEAREARVFAPHGTEKA